MNIFIGFLLFFAILKQNDGAKILGAVFTPSYSHQVAFHPIWKELSRRGHQVTVLTSDPIKDPKLQNLKEIDLSMSYKIINNVMSYLSENYHKLNMYRALDTYCLGLHDIADLQFRHPEVKKLINDKSQKFDLVMVEVIFPTQMAFAHHFGVPFIGLMSLDAPPRIHEAIGNPTNPALYPNFILPFVPPLKFHERLISVITAVFMKWYDNFVLYPREDETVKKHFGDNFPDLSEIQRNMSMLFLNVNPVFHNIRPVGPNTILIGGGTHMKKSNPLPKEIHDYLDNAKQGLIYFSLGTNVKSKELTNSTKQVILDTFRELPYKILWKFEDESLSDKPDNVKIMKWIPQQDVFRHPNVKLFITQCGLQSMEEAIFNHIPMVGVPIFGDQINNGKILEMKGLGIQLNYKQLSKEAFKSAIMEVLKNPKYRNNVKEIAELSNDIEKSGVERAVWWTEYVIRHKGAEHFRNPAADIPLYQYLLLDVIGLIVIVIMLLVYIIVKLLKLIRVVFRYCFRNKKKCD